MQVATAAEFELGAGKQFSSLLGVFWGTGVGGGIVLNGTPWRGRGGAGEIGHMVIKLGGRRCPCGNDGCVEAYAGRAAMEAHARHEIEGGRKSDLLKIMEQKDRERFTSAVWATAVEHEDELAIELIDGAVEALGAGAASAINLLDIEAVVIGGGLGVRFGDAYVDRIREAMTKHLFPGHKMPARAARRSLAIWAARLGLRCWWRGVSAVMRGTARTVLLLALVLVGSLVTPPSRRPRRRRQRPQLRPPGHVLPGTSCPIFPADDVWNTPVTGLPVDRHSAAVARAHGGRLDLPASRLRAGWGSQPLRNPVGDHAPGIRRSCAFTSCTATRATAAPTRSRRAPRSRVGRARQAIGTR